jgi:protoporphyrinogen oxidase
MTDVAVVGGGILGLAVAQRLRERGDDVALFESSPHLGGLACRWEADGVVWDRHYHVILDSDTHTRRLLRSIGLERDLRWVQTKTAVYAGPEVGVWPLTGARDLLRLPTLRPIDKARLAATFLAGMRPTDERMDAQSVREWLTRWSGRRAFERFWLPLLRAKLGEEWRHASASVIAATMHRLYRTQRMTPTPARFGYVRGGYGRVIDHLAADLADSGVKIHIGTQVRRIVPRRVGLELQLDGASDTFDRVVVTTGSHFAADLCPALTEEEMQRLRDVRYMGMLSASLLLPYSLSPYFLTYLTDPGAPFTAVVEMTSMMDKAEVGGHTLIYLPRYVRPDDPLLDEDDDALRERFLEHLCRIQPKADAADVIAFKVSRIREVFAVPTVGYSHSMPPTTTTIPGLQLIGSANLPFATLNVNDTLSLLQELR